MTDFILASASPRRKKLLSRMGISFQVLVPKADEDAVPKDIPVNIYVQELAILKAATIAKYVVSNKNAFIISADTIVTLDGKILGKPRDADDAFEILQSLSGKEHEVYTGICAMRISDGKTVCRAVKTLVKFKELTEDKIYAYIATGEPMDKAGAYGIQGKGGLLIDGINGDYFNVVGLPISTLADVLENEFEIKIF